MSYYTLDAQGRPVPCDSDTWSAMFSKTEARRLAKTEVRGLLVSTVFLGLDHRFGGGGPPILWETIIFGLPGDPQPMQRYTSRSDALDGHDEAVCVAHLVLEEMQP